MQVCFPNIWLCYHLLLYTYMFGRFDLAYILTLAFILTHICHLHTHNPYLYSRPSLQLSHTHTHTHTHTHSVAPVLLRPVTVCSFWLHLDCRPLSAHSGCY